MSDSTFCYPTSETSTATARSPTGGHDRDLHRRRGRRQKEGLSRPARRVWVCGLRAADDADVRGRRPDYDGDAKCEDDYQKSRRADRVHARTQWAHRNALAQGRPICIRYSFEFAARISTGAWKARKHKQVADEARRAWKALKQARGQVWIRHARAGAARDLAVRGQQGERIERIPAIVVD